MKSLIIPISSLLVCSQVVAFDPVGPPPIKTVEWTFSYITNVKIPRIDFDDSSSLGECLDFLNLAHGAPKAYRTEIDGSALGEVKLSAPSHLKLQARDITLIEVLGKIADAVDADVVIKAGIIRLVPRSKIAEQVAPSNGDKTSN